MREALEKTIRELWQGADTTPDIIVSLEAEGIKVTEKRVLDTAVELGMKGSNVHSELYKNPTLIDKWWKAFGVREEKSALELLKLDTVKGTQGIGRARHIAGCCIADELMEKGAKPDEVASALKKKGFEEKELQKIRKDVGF